MFNKILYQPILDALLFIHQYVGNLGVAIIILTIGIRLVLLPVTLPSLKSATKMRDLKPEIDALKKKHGDDKQALQKAQMELFQKHQVNPAAGCLPQIVQIIVLIALYRVFIDFLQNGHIENTHFLWFNTTQPDPLYILPVLAALVQLVLALMIQPATSTAAEKTLAEQTEEKDDDKQAQDMEQMAATMQQQMIFLMPLMTGFIALRFPAGLAVYWVISTLFSAVQQYLVSGWGGLPHRLSFLPFINTQETGKE